jgi:hypothetical protein
LEGKDVVSSTDDADEGSSYATQIKSVSFKFSTNDLDNNKHKRIDKENDKDKKEDGTVFKTVSFSGIPPLDKMHKLQADNKDKEQFALPKITEMGNFAAMVKELPSHTFNHLREQGRRLSGCISPMQGGSAQKPYGEEGEVVEMVPAWMQKGVIYVFAVCFVSWASCRLFTGSSGAPAAPTVLSSTDPAQPAPPREHPYQAATTQDHFGSVESFDTVCTSQASTEKARNLKPQRQQKTVQERPYHDAFSLMFFGLLANILLAGTILFWGVIFYMMFSVAWKANDYKVAPKTQNVLPWAKALGPSSPDSLSENSVSKGSFRN